MDKDTCLSQQWEAECGGGATPYVPEGGARKRGWLVHCRGPGERGRVSIRVDWSRREAGSRREDLVGWPPSPPLPGPPACTLDGLGRAPGGGCGENVVCRSPGTGGIIHVTDFSTSRNRSSSSYHRRVVAGYSVAVGVSDFYNRLGAKRFARSCTVRLRVYRDFIRDLDDGQRGGAGTVNLRQRGRDGSGTLPRSCDQPGGRVNRCDGSIAGRPCGCRPNRGE